MTQRSERFQKHHRLLDSRDFQSVFKQDFRSVDHCLLVIARARPDFPARLGLAISKKKIARASDRNRLKRLIRESFRKHKHELEGLDIVVINHRHMPTMNNPEINHSLQRHWQRLIRCAT